MKIRLTQEQYKLISENVTYAPEKIDEILNGALVDLGQIREKLKLNLGYVSSLSIIEVSENIIAIEKKRQDIKNFEDSMAKKSVYYFKVVDAYGVRGQPPNVLTLDDISTKIDHVLLDLGYVGDMYDALIDMAGRLKKLGV